MVIRCNQDFLRMLHLVKEVDLEAENKTSKIKNVLLSNFAIMCHGSFSTRNGS